MTNGRYGKDYRPAVMADVVSKLTFESCTAAIKSYTPRR